MDSREIRKQKKMAYAELTTYLLEKYGKVPYDYFCNDSCKSKNHKNSRAKEGLFIHHIDEDKAIMLATPRCALLNPFDYQKSDRLVYCNYMEHLLLHVKIMEEPRHKYANPRELTGIGGAVNFIVPELNDYYMGYKFTQEWRLTAFKLVENNYEDYLQILVYIWDIIQNTPTYRRQFSIDRLCKGFADIYTKIKKIVLSESDKKNYPLTPKNKKCSLREYYNSINEKDIFYSKEYYGKVSNYTVIEKYLNDEESKLYVATFLADGIKNFYLTQITIEDNTYQYVTDSYFEEGGLTKNMTLAKGKEWTGEDSIDDFC